MSKKTAPHRPRLIYVLRVGVAGIKPRIWRGLSVPGDSTLEDLYEILQIAFGWGTEHLHSFPEYISLEKINNLALKGEVCCSPVVVRLRV